MTARSARRVRREDDQAIWDLAELAANGNERAARILSELAYFPLPPLSADEWDGD